jgi:hypothetical protein
MSSLGRGAAADAVGRQHAPGASLPHQAVHHDSPSPCLLAIDEGKGAQELIRGARLQVGDRHMQHEPAAGHRSSAAPWMPGRRYVTNPHVQNEVLHGRALDAGSPGDSHACCAVAPAACVLPRLAHVTREEQLSVETLAVAVWCLPDAKHRAAATGEAVQTL